MKSTLKLAAASLAMATAVVLAPTSTAKSPSQMNAKETAEWGDFVRQYLVENPEVIIEALQALEMKRDAEAIAQKQQMLPAILAHSNAPTLGPADAPITIIEFYDYNCGYCKRTTDWILSQVDSEQGDVRVIFMDLPILTELSGSSGVAARASLAAANQGKFREFHQAMMKLPKIDDGTIAKVSREVGIDYGQLRQDMKSPEIQAALEENISLARAAQIDATPGFYVNGEYVSGANIPLLDKLVADARKG